MKWWNGKKGEMQKKTSHQNREKEDEEVEKHCKERQIELTKKNDVE